MKAIGCVSLKITPELVLSFARFLVSNIVFSELLFFTIYLGLLLHYFSSQALINEGILHSSK